MADENQPSFVDKLKAKADELHLKEKVEQLADEADKLTRQAAGKLGEVTHENRDKVEGFLDKAASKVDEQTGGKYSDKIAKARESASKGVDKVEEQRTQGGEPAPGTSGHAAPPPAAPPAAAPPVTPPTATGSTPVTPPAAADSTPPAPEPLGTETPAPTADESGTPAAPDEPLPSTGGPATQG